MPTVNTPTDEAQALSSIAARVEALERRTVVPDRPKTQDDVPFTLPGAISVSESPRYYSPSGGALVRVFASLRTAGTSATVVTVKVNGVAIGTVTIPSGSLTASTYPGEVRVAADSDYITVAVTTAGAGAKDLSVQVRLKG